MRQLALDLGGLAGAASIVYGAYQLLPALAFVVGGALALTGAIVMSAPPKWGRQ